MTNKGETTMKITTVERPYTITFLSTGSVYPLSSEEAQAAIDQNPVLSATRNKVLIQGMDQKCVLRPATLGGGPAFLVER